MMLKMSSQECKKIRLEAETKKKTPNFGQVKSDQNLIPTSNAGHNAQTSLNPTSNLYQAQQDDLVKCREPYSLYLSNKGPESSSSPITSSYCLNNHLARSDDFFKSAQKAQDSTKSPLILEKDTGCCQVAFSSLDGGSQTLVSMVNSLKQQQPPINTSFTTRSGERNEVKSVEMLQGVDKV